MVKSVLIALAISPWNFCLCFNLDFGARFFLRTFLFSFLSACIWLHSDRLTAEWVNTEHVNRRSFLPRYFPSSLLLSTMPAAGGPWDMRFSRPLFFRGSRLLLLSGYLPTLTLWSLRGTRMPWWLTDLIRFQLIPSLSECGQAEKLPL